MACENKLTTPVLTAVPDAVCTHHVSTQKHLVTLSTGHVSTVPG